MNGEPIQFHKDDLEGMKKKFGENLILEDTIVDKDEAFDLAKDATEDLLDNQDEAIDLTKDAAGDNLDSQDKAFDAG